MRRGSSRSGLRPKCFYPLTFQGAVGCVRHRTKAVEPKCFCPLILHRSRVCTIAPLPRTKILLPKF
jgi:hypothetical protein